MISWEGMGRPFSTMSGRCLVNMSCYYDNKAKLGRGAGLGQKVARLFWGTPDMKSEVLVGPQRGVAGKEYLGSPRAGELRLQLCSLPSFMEVTGLRWEDLLQWQRLP